MAKKEAPFNQERIAAELARASGFLEGIGAAVSVFGSARFREGSRYYSEARELGKALAQQGYAVITGGGPGIMEAANRGAKEGEGISIGLNIILPHEQHSNGYLDREMEFYYFFIRKLMFVHYSSAFIVLPGGFGTLDELFEVLTLMQTGKSKAPAVLLYGREYWQELEAWIREKLLGSGAISERDCELWKIVDSVQEVLECMRGDS